MRRGEATLGKRIARDGLQSVSPFGEQSRLGPLGFPPHFPRSAFRFSYRASAASQNACPRARTKYRGFVAQRYASSFSRQSQARFSQSRQVVKKDKTAYRTRNWKQYNTALINRGRITLWINKDVAAA